MRLIRVIIALASTCFTGCGTQADFASFTLATGEVISVSCDRDYEISRAYYVVVRQPNGKATAQVPIGTALPEKTPAFQVSASPNQTLYVLVESSSPDIVLAVYETSTKSLWTSHSDGRFSLKRRVKEQFPDRKFQFAGEVVGKVIS